MDDGDVNKKCMRSEKSDEAEEEEHIVPFTHYSLDDGILSVVQYLMLAEVFSHRTVVDVVQLLFPHHIHLVHRNQHLTLHI